MGKADFEAALEFVRRCEFAADLESFRGAVLEIAAYVPGHITAYNEVDLRRRQVLSRMDPPGSVEPEQIATFERLAHQHPVIAHVNLTGDLTPRAISDFLSPEEFHRLDLYREFFGGLGVEDQIAIGLPGSGSELALGVVINRSERGFSSRERSFLEVISPHVGRSYAVARGRHLVREALAANELAPAPTSAVIVLDRAGRALQLGPLAEQLLETYFGAAVGRDGTLPEGLARYVAGVRDSARRLLPKPAPSELIVRRAGTRLRACLIEGTADGEPDVLLMETEADPLAAGRLRRLGLTPRETEIVALVAAGRSNDEIAAELAISPRTVKRHLENVFAKLGVPNRAGLVGRLLEPG